MFNSIIVNLNSTRFESCLRNAQKNDVFFFFGFDSLFKWVRDSWSPNFWCSLPRRSAGSIEIVLHLKNQTRIIHTHAKLHGHMENGELLDSCFKLAFRKPLFNSIYICFSNEFADSQIFFFRRCIKNSIKSRERTKQMWFESDWIPWSYSPETAIIFIRWHVLLFFYNCPDFSNWELSHRQIDREYEFFEHGDTLHIISIRVVCPMILFF